MDFIFSTDLLIFVRGVTFVQSQSESKLLCFGLLGISAGKSKSSLIKDIHAKGVVKAHIVEDFNYLFGETLPSEDF